MTTPSLLQAMVEALRLAVETDHQDVGVGVCQWCCHDVDLCDEASGCVGWKQRAALDAWGKRPRLRDDPDLRQVVKRYGAGGWDNVDQLLDALEPLLYGERG